ncbi:ATP-binding cassette domain-containing protein [Novosphingobium sp. FKTRR1]|uniref:ATP-binding cassette domain-containing protein n=1 Tax=Novosphingobium sp. FKTRR1 TaxID=2879118 RepID=UPI001CEFFE03|nr:ATP-binding cassette domain-containing protein [Novosphingobium sp. FKTRR1]
MIRLQSLTYAYRKGAPVIDGLTVDLPSDRRLAILGAQQSGKTTLVQLLAGLITPGSGSIERLARLSFPAGYQRGFRMASTLGQNITFAAKIYGADADEVIGFVADVTGLGAMVDRPLRDLSVQDRMNTSFALTYALPFDTYLFDNTFTVGEPDFRAKCLAMFEARSRTSGMIVATKFARTASQFCDCALVLIKGHATYYDDVAQGVAAYEQSLPVAQPKPAAEAPTGA